MVLLCLAISNQPVENETYCTKSSEVLGEKSMRAVQLISIGIDSMVLNISLSQLRSTLCYKPVRTLRDFFDTVFLLAGLKAISALTTASGNSHY
jgi:hypothetical protein